MNDAPTYLGGRLRIVVERSEMRMSQWIDNPRVVDARTGQSILDLHGSLWDLVQVEEEATSIVLRLRRYPGGAAPVEVAISPDRPGGVVDGVWVEAAALVAALEGRPHGG